MTDEIKTEFNLSNVRISYPHLFEPKSFPGNTGKPKHSAKFLLNKKDHAALIASIQGGIIALAKSSLKDKKVPPPDKLCLRDGDLSGKEEEAGCWVFSASEVTRPVVVDQNRSPLVEADDAIRGGYFVNAKVNLWAQDNQYGRRINANLLGVQLVKVGPLLGSGRSNQSADDMFDEVSGAFGDDSTADENPFG
jgi:hypothetical protein